jgi:hypothetical protein
LYLGSARTIIIADTSRAAAQKGDTAQRTGVSAPAHPADAPRGWSSHRNRIAARAGQPLQGAQVGIPDGPQTRANERGEWALSEVPAGTRVLEVRSVGFYPLRQPVEVIAGAPPIHVELQTFKAVLSTVKVTASYDRFRRLEEFKERARSGQGRYLTARRHRETALIVASDLFRNISGVYLDGSTGADTVMMRSPLGEKCPPTFYLNGLRLDALTADDID